MNTDEIFGQFVETYDGEITRHGGMKAWANVRIAFQLVSPTFPNNKIYGHISIIPESAQEFIKHFQVIVNDRPRAQFPSTSKQISIGGFNRKSNTSINLRITAIPKDSTLPPKSSRSCNFDFTRHNFGINPMFYFKWMGNTTAVIVRWEHVIEQTIEKYILLLDEREIRYVYRREFQPEYEFYIRDLEPNTSHTLQIIGKVRKAKRDCQSDVIHFTVPETGNALDDLEVLHVQEENVPQRLKAYIDINSDKSEEEMISIPKPRSSRNMAMELLEKLRRQIEERNRH